MSEIKKMPGTVQFTSYYKGDWTQQIELTSNGSAYDITGATATFVLYEMNGTAALSLATGGSGITHTGSGGVITITATLYYPGKIYYLVTLAKSILSR